MNYMKTMFQLFLYYYKHLILYRGDDIKLSERLYVPGTRLRGFEPGKIGPKDGSDFIGGNYVSSINATTTVPMFLENLQTVDIVFLLMQQIFGELITIIH